MDDPFWLYVLFNRCEAATWFAVALALPFLVKARNSRQKLATAAASIGFILFGFSDLFEAPLRGQLPAWLWTYKILCAGFILTCRFIYFGQFSVRDRYFHFGLACLAAVTGVMILQHYLYGS